MFVVEGDHVAAGREGPYGLGVGVVADSDIADHSGRRHVGALRQQPDSDTQSDRSRVHHPGELATPDDADGEGPHAAHRGSVPAR